MNKGFERYISNKRVAIEEKDGCYELRWEEGSLFHDYTQGWQAREDEEDDTVILDFTMLEPVDIRRFEEIFKSHSQEDTTLSFRDECQGKGSPCFSAKINLDEDDTNYPMGADAVILSLADTACSAWEDYVGSCSEEEKMSFSSHYGNGSRLLFVDSCVISISFLTHELMAFNSASDFLDEIDAKPLLHAPRAGGGDSLLDSADTLESEEDEDAAKWVMPDDSRGGGFIDVAGMDHLKKKVGDSVIWPLKHKEIAERYKVSSPGGMILYGPPGCGKSYFAEKFAQECGLPYRLVKPSELGSPFVHATQHMIARLFDEAEKKAPCVICMDEIDAMIPVRQTTNNSCKNDEVNEFLTQLNNCGKRGIFVIGTTNMKDLIDPAALRKGRLDYQVEIPAPDIDQRKVMFEYELKDRPQFLDVEPAALAAETEGYSCSDISYIVNEAALAAAIQQVDISQDMLEDQIRKTVPSLKKKSVRKVGFNSAASQQRQMMNLVQ